MAAAGGGNGGGGGGREIEAGRAFVALGLKDTVASGLDKLKGKFKSFADDAKKAIGTGVGLGFGGKIADALGDLAKDGIKLLKDEVRGLIPGLETMDERFGQFAESAKEAGKAAEKISEEFARLASFARGGALASVLGDEAGALGAQLDKLVRDRERLSGFGEATSEMPTWAKPGYHLGAKLGIFDGTLAEQRERVKAMNDELDAAIEEIRKKRDKAIEERGKILDPSTDATFVNKLEDFSRSMGDALDPKLKAMGQFEKAATEILRANEAANDATKQRLKDLVEEGRLTDNQLKAAEERARIAQDFASEMRKIEFDRITKDFAPGARGLAGMIDRGWSNEQILEAQERMRSLRDRGGTMTKGLGASVNAALSLGVADQWKRQEALMELTNEKLDELRNTLDGLAKNLAMR
jgi:hypothetical protein